MTRRRKAMEQQEIILEDIIQETEVEEESLTEEISFILEEDKVIETIVENTILNEEVKEEESIVQSEPQTPPTPTGKIFLEEEDKRILRKFNSHIVNKLGLHKTRSVKV